MPEPRETGDLPPDVPPEYADAYRRGYQHALHGATNGADEPTQAIGPRVGGAHAAAVGQTPPGPRHDGLGAAYGGTSERGSRWLVLVALAVMALLLVGSAYGLGRLFSAGVDEVDTAQPAPDGVNLGADGSAPTAESPGPKQAPEKTDKKQDKKPDGRSGERAQGRPYRGPVDAVTPAGSRASCRSDASVDAAGRPVSYPSTHAHDGNLTTAWRCDGSGSGETLTLRLPQRLPVGEVGLVPGYAKTDPANGVDRYAENNRITQVRWRFSDGSTYVQKMSGDEDDRSLRRTRIPLTSARKVTVEIVSTVRGPRDTVAISEVWVASATG